VAVFAVSFASGDRKFNGAARERRAMVLSRTSEESEAAFFEIANIETIVETAQFCEATRAKLRNRLRLLMEKLGCEETIQQVGDGLDTATDDEFGGIWNIYKPLPDASRPCSTQHGWAACQTG
jgi:hypothetical protein